MSHWHVLKIDRCLSLLMRCPAILFSQPRSSLITESPKMPALCWPRPLSRLVSRWLLSSVWPGQDGGHWGWPEQPSLASLILCQSPAPRPAESPEPEPSCVRATLSLSPLSIPDTKPLWAWARYPPPPGSPRIFTFKSPIQRFAFKCFFSETQSPSDYLHTAGCRNPGTDSQQLLKSERTFAHGSHTSDLKGVGPCLQYSLLRYARVSQYKW